MMKIKHLSAFAIAAIFFVSCEKEGNNVPTVKSIPKTDTARELSDSVAYVFTAYTDTFYGPAIESYDCEPALDTPSYVYAYYPSPTEVIFSSSYNNTGQSQYDGQLQGDFPVDSSNAYSDEIIFDHHITATYGFVVTRDSLYYNGRQNYGSLEYIISYAGKRTSKLHLHR